MLEGNFPEFTLEMGRGLRIDDVIVVEWTCDYGDGRLYRNVTICEVEDGEAVRVTDCWGPSRICSGRGHISQRGPGGSAQ